MKKSKILYRLAEALDWGRACYTACRGRHRLRSALNCALVGWQQAGRDYDAKRG